MNTLAEWIQENEYLSGFLLFILKHDSLLSAKVKYQIIFPPSNLI